MKRKRETPQVRKLQIMAAAELVLLDGGIDAFTMDQVVKKAGIAKGTVYNYYKNKDAMLAVLGAKALELLKIRFEAETEQYERSIDKIKGICRACYAFYQEYPSYFELISYMERPEFDINSSGYLGLSQQLQEFTHDIIASGQERGEINPKLNAQMVHYILWASCVGVVEFVENKQRLLENHLEIDTGMMVETFATIMTEGLNAK